MILSYYMWKRNGYTTLVVSCLINNVNNKWFKWPLIFSPESHLHQGDVYFKAGHWTESLDSFNLSLQHEADSDLQKADLFLKKADCFAQMGQFADVIEQTDECEFSL